MLGSVDAQQRNQYRQGHKKPRNNPRLALIRVLDQFKNCCHTESSLCRKGIDVGLNIVTIFQRDLLCERIWCFLGVQAQTS